MRILLIHNDNLNQNLVNSFDEDDILVFSIPNQTMLNPNFSFDKEAHEQLNDHFEEYGVYDLIVLPFNLSPDNYLEFTGIQLANHIRLTKVWQQYKTPILFLGEESPSQIARIVRADILFTRGVFCTTNQTFNEIANWAIKLQNSQFNITDDDYEEIIDKLVLEPPDDYDSHHNLDNEFTLYLWSKTIDLELEILKKEIESGLYFKWWNLKNKLEIDQSFDKLNESFNSKKDWNGKKVLLIDDQYKKGWNLFFKKLLPTVEVDFLDGNFEKPEQFFGKKNIVDSAIEKIISFDPHVILLDLRLTDSDNVKDKTQLTGIKILENFKKNNSINQGIQFISLSASDKIWNYEELLKKKVSSFIVKKTDNENKMNQTISVHRKLVYRKIEEADYLKEIYSKLTSLKSLLQSSIENDEYEIQRVQLELVFELIVNGISDPKYNNFAFHLLFQVLEGFIKSNKIFERVGNESKVICQGKKVLVRKEFDLKTNQREVKELRFIKGDRMKKPPVPNKFRVESKKEDRTTIYLETNFIVMCVLHIRLGLDAGDKKIEKWIKLNRKRNSKTGHGSNNKIIPIDTNEIKIFIDFLTEVFNDENQNQRNINLYKESFNLSKDNFNRPSGNTLGDFWKKD